MTERARNPKAPVPRWVFVTAVLLMLIGARLVYILTGFRFDPAARPFEPTFLLLDMALHAALFLGAYVALRRIAHRV